MISKTKNNDQEEDEEEYKKMKRNIKLTDIMNRKGSRMNIANILKMMRITQIGSAMTIKKISKIS